MPNPFERMPQFELTPEQREHEEKVKKAALEEARKKEGTPDYRSALSEKDRKRLEQEDKTRAGALSEEHKRRTEVKQKQEQTENRSLWERSKGR